MGAQPTCSRPFVVAAPPPPTIIRHRRHSLRPSRRPSGGLDRETWREGEEECVTDLLAAPLSRRPSSSGVAAATAASPLESQPPCLSNRSRPTS
jgi:hypothetical protein